MSDDFKCVLCNKKLDSKLELQAHFRDHASTKDRAKKKQVEAVATLPGKKLSVACDVCGDEFTNNTVAIQHKFRKHPEVNDKYYCPTCGMLFTIKAIYERHLESHDDKSLNVKQISCEICGAKFNNTTAKDYHLKCTHKRVMKLYSPVQTAPPSKKIRLNNAGDVQSVYFCHICGSEYIVKFNLQKHLEQCHTEEERSAVPSEFIRCTVCDALFYNRKAYDSHNLGHKPTDLYVTDEQSRLRAVTRIDQDFDMRRVMPLAEKYIPAYRRSSTSSRGIKKKDTTVPTLEEDDELSPPSSPDSSSNDSAEDLPLSSLKSTSEVIPKNLTA